MHDCVVPRYIFIVKQLAILILLSSFACAAEYKDAKIIDFHDATEVGAATINSIDPVGPASTDIPAMDYRCYLTVEMDHVKYSAIFPVNQHFKLSDLNKDDFIPARVAGNKLIIRTVDGKEMKSKIVERVAAKK